MIFDTTNLDHAKNTDSGTIWINNMVLNAFTDPVLVYDPTQAVKKVNIAFVQTYGFDPSGLSFEQFSGMFNVIPRDGYILDAEATSKALKGNKAEDIVFSISFGKGLHYIEANSAPLMEGNKIVGALTVWRKSKAVDRHYTKKNLKYDKRLIGLSPIAIIISRNGFIEYVNPVGLQLLGARQANELIGKAVLDIIHPDYHEIILSRLNLATIDAKEAEQKIVRLDGVIRDVEVMSVIISDKKDKIVQVYLKDITSKKKTEYFNQTLSSIEKVIHSSFNTFEISEKAMLMAANVIGCDSAAVSLLKDDHWEVLHMYNFPDMPLNLIIPLEEEPHALLALAEKKSILVEDAYIDPRVNNKRMLTWGIQSVIVMPLFTSHGNIGVIFFNYYKKRSFSPEKTIFLTRLSTALSLSLENSELFEQLQTELQTRKNNEQKLLRLNNTLLALSRSSQAMLLAENEKEYALQICEIITTICNQALAWVGFIDDSRITPLVWSGGSGGYIETLSINVSSDTQGPTSTAVNRKTHVICNDIETAPEFTPWKENAIKFGIGSCISLPLTYLDEVYGVLNIYSREKNAFFEDEVSLLSELSKYLSQGLVSIRLNISKSEAENDLKESEERFRMLAETSNALICELDKSGIILYGNARFREVFGSSILNKQTVFSLCFEDARERLFDHIFYQSLGSATNEWSLKDKKGNWRWFRCHYGVFNTPRHGKRWSLMLFDICDIKQAEDNLKKLAEELKVLNTTKDKFFNIIAHDLKNPFTGLMGGAELLTSSIDDREITLKLAKMIHDSARRGYSLLQNLLEWSRSQTGSIAFEPTRINVLNLIKDTTEGLRVSYETKEQKIEINVPGELEVNADVNMLSTIIRNLVQNAIKFSFNQGTICISSYIANNETIISVRDNGTGIPHDYLSKLFRIDEKISTPGTNKETGTGLGLLLCKEFIEKHGGRIWAESSEGHGSSFFVSLPKSI